MSYMSLFPMDRKSKIYVAGHQGLIGSAIVEELTKMGFKRIITKTNKELDLCNQVATAKFFSSEKPAYVFMAAGKREGVFVSESKPVDLLKDNTQMAFNVIDNAYKNGCEKLLYLSSSCVYPANCTTPAKEEYLGTGHVNSYNEFYAISKLAGIKMCQAYRKQFGFDAIVATLSNIYGHRPPDADSSLQVIPELLRRFHYAKTSNSKKVLIWGTGSPRNEFLYVEDLADALIFIMQNYSELEHINIGVGNDISIHELAEIIAKIVGFEGDIEYDTNIPDGASYCSLDVSKLTSLGWVPKMPLHKGLELTYKKSFELV